MAYLIMERSFDNALSDADLERMMARVSPCLHEYRVRWVRSYLSSTRQRMICAFEAPDAEAVRQAFRMSELPFERVWRGDVLTPDAE